METSFRIGEWLVKPQFNSIQKDATELHLEPKVMQVLVYLADHYDIAVCKEDLIRSVWGGAFVTDEVVSNAIWELRKALGDDAKNSHFIQTIPKKGYRLIAPVSGIAFKGKPNRTNRWPWMAACVVAAFATWFALEPGDSRERSAGKPAPPRIASVAVLPLENLSGDPEQEYFRGRDDRDADHQPGENRVSEGDVTDLGHAVQGGDEEAATHREGAERGRSHRRICS